MNPNQQQTNIQITNQIIEVCNEKSLTCLHAIESGSRAWGFASPDSDYDVRLIYKHDTDWYLRLISGRDTFEYIQNDLFDVPFDIGGWDIRKALNLVYKSNAVIFEWLNSPIIYSSDEQFFYIIKELQHEFFDPKALFFHYRGMAKNAHASLKLDEPIKLKKWFYLLRALLASVWSLQETIHPPVLMSKMFSLIDKDLQQEIFELIDIKKTVNENYQHQLSKPLQELTKKLWQKGNDLIESCHFPDKHQGNIILLDEIFKKMVFDK